MAELLLSCNGLTAHGTDLDRATYGCCMVELQLTCNEFDLNSLKLVRKPEDLMETGLAKGPAAAIFSAVHEHIAAEADAAVEAATVRLHQAMGGDAAPSECSFHVLHALAQSATPQQLGGVPCSRLRLLRHGGAAALTLTLTLTLTPP